MPASSQQINDFRSDIGDNGTTPIFDDPAIQRLYDRATAAYSDQATYEAEMRVLAIRQMLGDAAKLWNYKQNQSTDNMSDVFNHLKDLLKVWQDIRDSAAASTRGGGVAWGSIKKVPSRKYEMPDS